MQKAVAQLTKHIDQAQMLKHCVEVNRMENVADRIYRARAGRVICEQYRCQIDNQVARNLRTHGKLSPTGVKMSQMFGRSGSEIFLTANKS